MKRLICTLLCLLFALSAAAQDAPPDWMTGLPQPGAEEEALDKTVYDAADSAGEVVNVPPPDGPTQEEAVTFSFTPIDAVLVLDASGSMDRANASNGKDLLSYAQDAAIMFCETLFSINPASRAAVISYDDQVRVVRSLSHFNQLTSLQTGIRSMYPGGTTNTGGGYAQAVELLAADKRPGVNQVVLMLSDGLANVGIGDPVQYAIQQGWQAASDGKVYTIGLVGGMYESDKRITRDTLNAGYETQYYELDFDDISDISTQLASIFVTIATSGGADDDTLSYRMMVDGGMDVRVQSAQGASYLSSSPEDYASRAAFGMMATLGDDMDQKLMVFGEGDYDIRLHGRTTGMGSYTLTQLRGATARETVLLNQSGTTHPAQCYIIELRDGVATVRDVSYEPLDPRAIDPFTGDRTRGSQMFATGAVKEAGTLYAAPTTKAYKICEMARNTQVDVCAVDPNTGWYMVMAADDKPFRGWMPPDKLTVYGYVPNMIWQSGEWTVNTKTQAYAAPDASALPVTSIAQGGTVTLAHVERDMRNAEWAYVETTAGKRVANLYIPADHLDGWTPLAPDGFRIGYASPVRQWQQTLGKNGFTEVMWAAPSAGGGTVLSGRTSSTSGTLKARQGNRDAFALRLSPAGELLRAVTAGGSDWDSYHCIVPSQGGYLVGGVTRSNNKDFEGIWNTMSSKRAPTKTMDKTNALIGTLDADFNIQWLQSFGVGNKSYGFDMVLELADGNIAGVGWLSQSDRGTITGYGEQDFYVVKMTRDGQVLAMRNYGSYYNDVPDAGVATQDGGLIMVGSREGSRKADGYILVLDKDLNTVSECIYGGPGRDIFDNVRPLKDGTFLVTGFTDSPSGTGVAPSKGGVDFWAMNIDKTGQSIWVKRYGGSGDETLCGTTVLDNGLCLLVGSTTSIDGDAAAVNRVSGKSDAWVICINETGRLLWQFSIGGKGKDSFNSAAIDPADGGIVMGGTYNNTGSTDARGYVVKIMPPSYMNEVLLVSQGTLP